MAAWSSETCATELTAAASNAATSPAWNAGTPTGSLLKLRCLGSPATQWREQGARVGHPRQVPVNAPASCKPCPSRRLPPQTKRRHTLCSSPTFRSHGRLDRRHCFPEPGPRRSLAGLKRLLDLCPLLRAERLQLACGAEDEGWKEACCWQLPPVLPPSWRGPALPRNPSLALGPRTPRRASVGADQPRSQALWGGTPTTVPRHSLTSWPCTLVTSLANSGFAHTCSWRGCSMPRV